MPGLSEWFNVPSLQQALVHLKVVRPHDGRLQDLRLERLQSTPLSRGILGCI